MQLGGGVGNGKLAQDVLVHSPEFVFHCVHLSPQTQVVEVEDPDPEDPDPEDPEDVTTHSWEIVAQPSMGLGSGLIPQVLNPSALIQGLKGHLQTQFPSAAKTQTPLGQREVS